MSVENLSKYVHGTSPEEQRRLSTLNKLLNNAALKELALRGDEKILDVGCGLAQFSRVMAVAVAPRGHVLGIERSPEQLTEAKRQAVEDGQSNLVDLRLGDALSLPLRQQEWGSFDIAHARFLLEHVTDPLAVVRTMAQAVRSQGRIILQDDDHDLLRLWPEPSGFLSLWHAYIRTYDRFNNDPYVGRKLVTLLYESGIMPCKNTWLFFGSCSGNPNFELYVDNLVGILKGAREEILLGELLEPKQFDSAITTLENWKYRPDASFWYSVCWAEGIRP
jgi:ubiquinone/menaquinone biosynthesis C-methylase UbiE